MVKFGIIANTHGIKGHVKILSNSDFKNERLKVNNKLILKDKKTNQQETLTIKSWSKSNNFDLILFEEYSNINDVLKFKTWEVFVSDNVDVFLEEDEFLHNQLRKCFVLDQNQNQIGVVNDIVNFGGDDCLQIKTKNNEYKYIPFVDFFVKEIDVEKKVINVNLIEGLI